jgi:hypothetical protein
MPRPSGSGAPAGLAPAVLAVLAVLLALAAPPARATTVLPVDAHGLVDRAEVIFVGTAVHQETATTGDGRFPFTLVTFRVHETLKGATDPGELVLALPGGFLGDELYEIEGVPRFAVGEKVLVFARGNGARGFPIVGWSQGLFRLVADPGSGAEIVADAHGAAVHGLEGARWRKGAVAHAAHEGAAVTLLSTHGVEVALDAPGADAGEAPPAAAVLAGLRAAIRARAGHASFTPGGKVASARAEALPFTMDSAPAAPRTGR